MFDHYDAHGLPVACDKAEAEIRDLRAEYAELYGQLDQLRSHSSADLDTIRTLRAELARAQETAAFVPAIRDDDDAPLHQHACGYIEELRAEDVAAGWKCPWCSEHGDSEWWPLYRRQREAPAGPAPIPLAEARATVALDHDPRAETFAVDTPAANERDEALREQLQEDAEVLAAELAEGEPEVKRAATTDRDLCWKPVTAEDGYVENCGLWENHAGQCLLVCGDCREGRCHIPIRPPAPGIGDPDCGCARHASSLAAWKLGDDDQGEPAPAVSGAADDTTEEATS